MKGARKGDEFTVVSKDKAFKTLSDELAKIEEGTVNLRDG